MPQSPNWQAVFSRAFELASAEKELPVVGATFWNYVRRSAELEGKAFPPDPEQGFMALMARILARQRPIRVTL